MFTADENKELFVDASAIAYRAVLFSGLSQHLTGVEWDELADEWGKEVVSLLSQKCEAKLEAIADEAMRVTEHLEAVR